jgi:hypothetical protein
MTKPGPQERVTTPSSLEEAEVAEAEVAEAAEAEAAEAGTVTAARFPS